MLTGSQSRSIEAPKRVVQKIAVVVVVVQGRRSWFLYQQNQHSFSTEKQCKRCPCGTPIWDVRTGQQLHYYCDSESVWHAQQSTY